MPQSKFERVAEDSPDRCQGRYSYGQCSYKKLEGFQFCPMHGSPQTSLNKAKVHDYRLTTFKQRHDEFANSDIIKSVAGEIGVMRIILEELTNKIVEPNDVLIYSDKMSNLANQIMKLVLTFQSIQEKNRDLLDKTVVFNIADAMVNIICEHIEDPDELILISEKLNDAISKLISGETTARPIA